MKYRFLRSRPPPLSARKKIAPRKKTAHQKNRPPKKSRQKKLHFSLDILFLCTIIAL